MPVRYYKYSKDEVDYTDHAKNHDERCILCTHYRMGRLCALVRGEISPEGWCKKFKAEDA